MKKLGWIFGSLLAAFALIGVVFSVVFPRVGAARQRTVEASPQNVERGRYLANHVTVCVDCHSTRDWSRFSGPVQPGTEGRGGERFGHEFGFPGEFYSANIT